MLFFAIYAGWLTNHGSDPFPDFIRDFLGINLSKYLEFDILFSDDTSTNIHHVHVLTQSVDVFSISDYLLGKVCSLFCVEPMTHDGVAQLLTGLSRLGDAVHEFSIHLPQGIKTLDQLLVGLPQFHHSCLCLV